MNAVLNIVALDAEHNYDPDILLRPENVEKFVHELPVWGVWEEDDTSEFGWREVESGLTLAEARARA